MTSLRESDLIYDWNRQGDGEMTPARGRVELNDETLRDGLQSPVRVDAVDRGQDRDPPPDGRARRARARPRSPRRRAARGARRAGARARDRRRQAAARRQLRRADGARRHRADRRHLAAGGDPDRGGDLHRLLADPPVLRGVGHRPHAAPHRGRRAFRGRARAAGDVRHRGHDARPSGRPAPALHHRGRSRRPRASASPTRSATRPPTVRAQRHPLRPRGGRRHRRRGRRSTGTATATAASA